LIFILALSFSITDKALASAKKQEQKQEQSQSWFLDLWLTADQKGQYYFNQQQYEKAALAYQDSFKKGVAFYYAGKFSEAYQQFKTIDSEQALFYQANSLAQQRNYVPARDLYQVLIEQNPEFTAAKTNLAIVDNIIKETDAFTDKQQEEQSEGGQELGDNPQSSEGAQRKMGSAESQLGKKPEQETADDLAKERGAVTGLTAEQILQDEALQESWLKEVTQDPAAFLGAKFQIQASKKAEDLEVLQ
jgi:Ca-activated chloride channel family protein